jgi:hypothetical protein
MSLTPNRRNLVDTNVQTTAAMPAAAANSTSTGLDIGAAGPDRERMFVRIDLPVNSVLVATKTIIFTLFDSADNSTFAAANPGVTYTITGDTGFPAQTVYLPIPPDAEQYVAVNAAVLTAGGDNTGTTATYSIVS